MAFQLAELFVGIAVKTDAFKTAMHQVQSDLVKSGATAGKDAGSKTGEELHNSIISKVGGLSGALSVALGGFLFQGVNAGWNALKGKWTETVGEAQKMEGIGRKLKLAFGDAAQGMIDQAEAAGEALGIPDDEAMKAADKFGKLALRQGKSREEAGQYGIQMALLAGDIQSASMETLSYEEAVNKVFKGAMGASRGLRDLGISFTQQQVKAKAAEMGFKEVGGVYRQADLAAARLALISHNAGIAQGDLAARANSAGVAVKRAGEIWGNIYEDVGKVILPIQKEWQFGQLNIALTAKAAFSQAKPYIEEFGKTIRSSWEQLKSVALPAINAIRSAVSALAGTFTVSISPLSATLTGLTAIGIVVGPMVVSAFTGIVVAAAPVVGAIGLLYGAFRIAEPYIIQFADFMIDAWPRIRATVVSSIETIRERFFSFIGVIPSIINNIFGAGTTEKMASWGVKATGWLSGVGESIKSVWRNLPDYAEIAYLKVYQNVVNLGHWLKTTFESIASYALVVPEKLLHAFNYVMSHGLVDTFKEIYNAFKTFGELIAGGFEAVFSGLWARAEGFGTKLLQRMMGAFWGADPFANFSGAVKDAFKESPFEDPLAKIKKSGKDAEDYIKKMKDNLAKASKEQAPDVSSSKIAGLNLDITLRDVDARLAEQRRLQDKSRKEQAEKEEANLAAAGAGAGEAGSARIARWRRREDEMRDAQHRRHLARVEKEESQREKHRSAAVKHQERIQALRDKRLHRERPAALKDTGERNVAEEGYREGAPKLTDAAQFATNLRLSLLGGDKQNLQERQTKAAEKTAENTDPKNAKPQLAVVS